ncbi:MAG: ribosome biogenesis GTPase YqeH [Bacilli bacterium]|nr:ribosome biogenesis GTPase YqeH [Bacilli bacterium]
MKTKCDGCGVKIQMTSPDKKGYIRSEVYLKNPDNFLCERCYNLKHYNRIADVEIEEEAFLENAKEIAKSKALVVNIVDVFDLEGTIIENINELFPDNKIIIVANKFDLFLSSTKPNKVLNYLREYFKERKIYAQDISLISSRNDKDIIRLLNKIYKIKESNEIYFFGVTNVGKSSIINAIINVIDNKSSEVTVSNIPGTTLGLIKVSLPEKNYIIDTPGIIHSYQYSKYLEKATLNTIFPKKFVKPRVYQLTSGQSVFVGGFAIFNFLDGEKASFVSYFANPIVIHRTKLENSENFFELHKDDILLIPSKEERDRLGDLTSYVYQIDGKVDISISGLGFMTITGKATIEVFCYEKIRVSIREAMIK